MACFQISKQSANSPGLKKTLLRQQCKSEQIRISVSAAVDACTFVITKDQNASHTKRVFFSFLFL